jgi:hypothetical protein
MSVSSSTTEKTLIAPEEILQKEFTSVKGFPFPASPLQFFDSSRKHRIFLDIAESASVWKHDLCLAEKLFADIVVCSKTDDTEDISLVKDILQKRMKYPSIQENPEYLAIAKTWILPTKVHQGPSVQTLFANMHETFFHDTILDTLKMVTQSDHETLQCVKIELAGGMERNAVYQLLDNGFRPGLFLVRWTHDVDSHYATALCAGHLLNCGYRFVRSENGYFLYVFKDECLYDSCSLAIPSLGNPMIQTIVQDTVEAIKNQQTTSTTHE